MNVPRQQYRPSLAIVAAAYLCLPIAASWAGGAEDIGHANPTQPQTLSAIDHRSYDKLLGKYVDPKGAVDYRRWYSNQSDRTALRNYLKQLSRTDSSRGTKDQRLAFWINVYNALTLDGILREYPTDSIRDHTAKFFGYNIWDDFRLYVDGKPRSLNDIEHKILRPMGEPRIHFAIVCASRGCPRLLNQSYKAASLDEQLTANAIDFFAQPHNFAVSNQTIQLSSILDWFKEDFGKTPVAVVNRIRPFLPKSAMIPRSFTIRYTDYDWSLNTQN